VKLATSASLLGLVASLGCATQNGQFKDQPIVWNTDDRKHIPEPEERDFLLIPFGAEVFLTGRLVHALGLPDREPAWNTNALDEVPNSTWFQNRIGVRQITPKEAATAASGSGPPRLPLTVVGGKSAGGNPGFFVKDARGKKFLVKFDIKSHPELETAASVIVNRIFWTLGYNVPNDCVFEFARSDLTIDPKATLKDAFGDEQPMTEADVDKALSNAPRLADGRIRASSSEFLKGVPKGGFPPKGVRKDDPNDTVPHQHRREVRAVHVFGAWTNHSDMKEDNTLDMYVTENGKSFLRHYFLDFGEALGGHPAEKNRMEDGTEHYFDWERQGRALVSFGLWKRPWEDIRDTPWASIGPFVSEPFDPRNWREAYPYWPFFETDAADEFWAAKLVMRFDRPILEAIVKTGKLSQPDAAAYLVKTLLERRNKIGHAYVEALTPLDDFRIDREHLCARDLGMVFGLAKQGTVELLDEHDDVTSEHTIDNSGRVCLPVPEHDRYTVYRLRIVRKSIPKPPLQIHFKAGDKARILGLVRVER
jgi:hypothetical protein